jgi:hypothetical protein
MAPEKTSSVPHRAMEKLTKPLTLVAIGAAAVAGAYLILHDGFHLDITAPHAEWGTSPPKVKSHLIKRTFTTHTELADFCPQTVAVDDAINVSSSHFLGGDLVNEDMPIEYNLCSKAGLALGVTETHKASNGAIIAVKATETNYAPQGTRVDLYNGLSCLTVATSGTMAEIKANLKEYKYDVKHHQVVQCHYGQQTTLLGWGGWLGRNLGNASSGEVSADMNAAEEFAGITGQLSPITPGLQKEIKTKTDKQVISFLHEEFPGAATKVVPPDITTTPAEQMIFNWAYAPQDMQQSVLNFRLEDQNNATVLNITSIQNKAQGQVTLSGLDLKPAMITSVNQQLNSMNAMADAAA